MLKVKITSLILLLKLKHLRNYKLQRVNIKASILFIKLINTKSFYNLYLRKNLKTNTYFIKFIFKLRLT